MKTNEDQVGQMEAFPSIPTARRHVYFYSVLLLMAVVLSNMKERVIGSTADDVAKAKQSASKIVGTQLVQSMN